MYRIIQPIGICVIFFNSNLLFLAPSVVVGYPALCTIHSFLGPRAMYIPYTYTDVRTYVGNTTITTLFFFQKNRIHHNKCIYKPAAAVAGLRGILGKYLKSRGHRGANEFLGEMIPNVERDTAPD
jgi:hypothetical protein